MSVSPPLSLSATGDGEVLVFDRAPLPELIPVTVTPGNIDTTNIHKDYYTRRLPIYIKITVLGGLNIRQHKHNCQARCSWSPACLIYQVSYN